MRILSAASAFPPNYYPQTVLRDALKAYWGERLGKSEFTAFQSSARGGVVRVRLNGDRVILGGQAVTVLRGELLA